VLPTKIRLSSHCSLPVYYTVMFLPVTLSCPVLVGEVKLLGPLSRSIRSIERKLVTKIITRIDRKLRAESIKPN
jgi:hypothetical protein